MEPETKQKLSIPMAIIVAGVLIAGAVYFSSIKPSSLTETEEEPQAGNAELKEMKAITEADHIRGDINAPVKIVEYSDTECPFCKQFHLTMKKIMDEYGKDGKVAWIYRHFPLDLLHSKARKEAAATECANELGGNEKFWAYLDRIYEITPANDGLDLAQLPKIAEYVGLNVADFNTCLDSNKYTDKIEQDYQDAVATGGRGTPWNIVIAKNGEMYPINGALPYESMKELIDFALE